MSRVNLKKWMHLKSLAFLLVFVLSFMLTIPHVEAASKQKIYSISFKTSADFILGETKADISFKLAKSSSNVKVYIVNSLDQSVKAFNVGKLSAGTKKQLVWDGKNNKGSLASEEYYRVKVVTDKVKAYSSTLYAKEQKHFAGGNGSKSNPYQVATIDHLDNIRKYNNKYFKQIKDIDFEFTGFDPLFTSELPFKGTYNGGNFKIQNFNLSKPDTSYVGLFAALGSGGKINNVVLDNCMVSGGDLVGALVGMNEGNIVLCEVNGTVSGTMNKHRYSVAVGAICGINKGIINSCKSSGGMSAVNLDEDEYSRCGGIVGENLGTIINSQSSASVNSSANMGWNHGDATVSSGGIAGLNSGIIKGSTASGNIMADESSRYCYSYAGGIAGENTSQITESTYTGSSLTAEYIGNIVADTKVEK